MRNNKSYFLIGLMVLFSTGSAVAERRDAVSVAGEEVTLTSFAERAAGFSSDVRQVDTRSWSNLGASALLFVKEAVKEAINEFATKPQPQSLSSNLQGREIPQRIPSSTVGEKSNPTPGAREKLSDTDRAQVVLSQQMAVASAQTPIQLSRNGVYSVEIKEDLSVILRLQIPREEVLGVGKNSKLNLKSEFENNLAQLLIVLHTPEIVATTEVQKHKQLAERLPSPALTSKFSELKLKRDSGSRDLPAELTAQYQKTEFAVPESLKKYTPLTAEEYRFLAGILLFQNGYQCPAAIGLFHSIADQKRWQAEADTYLALCSKRMGLSFDFLDRARRVFESQDQEFSLRLLNELPEETAGVQVKGFAEALETVLKIPAIWQALTPERQGLLSYLLAQSAASHEKFKTALEWAKKVQAKSSKYLKAQFITALSEYSIGSKTSALQIQENLIQLPALDDSAREFQGMVALNLARMYFQEQKYPEAHKAFMHINKDHPLWLPGLSEMGWAQLLSGDLGGAIGNMYSIQSPYFHAAYKPESYVVRTIGYLNLCQYGDAYKSLSILEKEYRPILQAVDQYQQSHLAHTASYYDTIRKFFKNFSARAASSDSGKSLEQVDGLPGAVIRELVRQKDFTNLQKSLNREIDERDVYSKLLVEIQASLKVAQEKVAESRNRIEKIRKEIDVIHKTPKLAATLMLKEGDLRAEQARLSDHFFKVDLFNEALAAWPLFKKEIVDRADRRLTDNRGHLESTLRNRLLKLKTDLNRYLDNNELLRYEVFAGSGENLRFQIAGGKTAEASNRVPASVLPQNKALRWDFDGEYWEDEIGHYRSSLKNNCPEAGSHAPGRGE